MGKKPLKQPKQKAPKPKPKPKPKAKQLKQAKPKKAQKLLRGRKWPKKKRRSRWSETQERYLFPFELGWEDLSQWERESVKVIARLPTIEAARLQWDDIAHRRDMNDPLGDCNNWMSRACSKQSEKHASLNANAALGLLWKGADVAGFALVHSAFRSQLASVVLDDSNEHKEHWERFTSSPKQVNRFTSCNGEMRAPVNAETKSLCYWNVLCPQMRARGFCEAGCQCPFSLNDEEVKYHPASIFANSHRRSIASCLSFEFFFGREAVTFVDSPSKWACNSTWWKFSVVTAVHVYGTAPFVELEVQHGTLGPGRSGPTEKRYVILPQSRSSRELQSAILLQLPCQSNVLLQPRELVQVAGMDYIWSSLRQKCDAFLCRILNIQRKGATLFETLHQDTRRRIFSFMSWPEFASVVQSSSQFLRLRFCWYDGHWRLERDRSCNTTQHIANSLKNRGPFRERGGSWKGKRLRESQRKRARLQEAQNSYCASEAFPSQDVSTSSQHLGLTDSSLQHLKLEDEGMKSIAFRVGEALSVDLVLPNECPDQLAIWLVRERLERVWEWGLVRASETYRRHLVRKGLDKSLFAMLQHLLALPIEEAEVASEIVLRFLADMAFVHTRQSRAGPRMLLGAASLDVLVRILLQFQANELVVARCLQLLACLVYRCDESRQVFAQQGGFDIIVAAMVHHDETESVLSAGMSALVNLTFPYEGGCKPERTFGYVLPEGGSVHSLCEQVFEYTERVNPNAIEEVTMGGVQGQGFTTKVSVSLITSEAQTGSDRDDEDDRKRPVRHLYMTVWKQKDPSVLRRSLQQAVVDNIGYGSLGKYKAIVFYSTVRERKDLSSALGGIASQFLAVQLCYVPGWMKVDPAAHEFWILWAAGGSPMYGTRTMPHELFCSAPRALQLNAENEASNATSISTISQCFDNVRCVASALRRLRLFAQTIFASSGNPTIGRQERKFCCSICDELKEATASCALCRQDIAGFLELLEAELHAEHLIRILCATAPSSEDVAVDGIRFLQSSISSRFLHGRHAGQPLEQLVADLRAGCCTPSSLKIELVYFHGCFRTLNHRRLWAIKTWASEANRNGRPPVVFNARVLPLIGGTVDSGGREAVQRFMQRCTSENDGMSIVIRATRP